MNELTLRQSEFLKPKYWLTWIGIAVVRAISKLPLKVRWKLGSWLGELGYLLARSRRHIVKTNLELCFPNLTEQEIQALTKENFRSSGISIIETAQAWFDDPASFRDIVDIEGLGHLEAAKASGSGVMLLGTHLSTLDFCGAVLGTEIPFEVMYRRNKNKLLETIMTRGRVKNFPAAIERSDVRSVIRRLKSGAIVWYGPDQDYGRKHSLFVPFFGKTAATITATARIAGMTGAKVVPYAHYRDLATGRYRIQLLPVLEDFPADNEEASCTRVNQIVEQAILVAPEQYWWVHRRFKTQPEGKLKLYNIVS